MYQKGLIIGRFQPFHKGHLFVVCEALKHVGKIIIGIGSTNSEDKVNNPFSYHEVHSMIEQVAKQEGWEDRISQIFDIPDTLSDDGIWLQDVLGRAQEFDVVISNNDWVTDIFRGEGFDVIELPFYKRHIYEGKKIREKMRKRGEI
ncbi:MAG: adenylyltransferase/cytidyltransferase family protein [bacterium]|nr:adenylyltransferase/cytidyltransferase family protein [bacterium]